jgi:hypothetical protein
MNRLLSTRFALVLLFAFRTAFFSFILPSQVKAEAEKMNVAPNHSFEKDLTKIKTNVCVFGGWFPVGVVTEDGSSEIRVVEDIARAGSKALRVTPNSSTLKGTIYYSQYNGGEEVRKNITNVGVSGARTIALRLDQDIVSCNASIWVKKAAGQEITLKAIWYTRRNRIPFIKMAEQATSQPVERKNGWFKYSLHAMRCHTARQVQVAIETKGVEPFYLDDVEVYFNRYPHVDILVDQLGYETQSDAKGIIYVSLQIRFRSEILRILQECLRENGQNAAITVNGTCITGTEISQLSRLPVTMLWRL